MNKNNLRKLWFPFLIFGVFAGAAFLNKDILFQFGATAISQTQKVFAYVVQIGIWISAAHFLNRIIIVFFWDGFIKKMLGAPVPRLLKDVLTIIIYFIAITGIVGFVFNKSVTGFWTTSGIIGLVLGLALKNMILDVFTGLAINIDRPYKIGEWIKVHSSGSNGDLVGQVMETNWRTTRLYTEDDSLIIVPNSILGTKVVTNFWGAGPGSRFETSFCLDFSIPTDRACRILQAGAKAVTGQDGILEEPEPNVIVSTTNELGVIYKIRFWMHTWGNGITFGRTKSKVNESILEHLKQAGITPAYPKQDLYYAKMPVRHLDSKSLTDRTKLLSRTDLFKNLEADELKELATRMKQHTFSRDERLINQGDAGDSMFILSEGVLHAYINTNQNGNEIKVGQIIPGQFFGEMSLLTGEPRSATIIAATDVIVHEVTKANINGLLSKRPELAETISQVVAARKVQNSQKMAEATVEERIEETKNVASQILNKMKMFFKGVFERKSDQVESHGLA